MVNQNSLEMKVVERMTGLSSDKIMMVQKGENPYGVDIVLILQIMALVVKFLPTVLDWFDGWFARPRMYFLAKKLILEEGKVNISAMNLANSTYNVLKER